MTLLPLPATACRAGVFGRRRSMTSALLLAAALGSPAAWAAVDCAPQALSCAVSGNLAGSVMQFRAGNRGDAHWGQATIAFANHAARPVTLAYRGGSGMLFDDQGNTYEAVTRNVRGIGVSQGGRVDTRFTLQPGESAQAQFEFQWSRQRGEITGLRFQMSTVVVEVTPQPGGAVRMGREHVLRWGGLSDTPGAAAAAAGARPSVAAGPAGTPRPAAALPSPDSPGMPSAEDAATAAATPQGVVPPAAGLATAAQACPDRAPCQDLGGFAVEVTRLLPAKPQGAAHPVRAEFRVRNTGNVPIALGLVSGSPLLIDENGNRYQVGNTNVHVHGIGMVTRDRASLQFALAPGQSRGFALDFNGYGRFPMARRFAASLTLAQLEPLPGNQVRTVREHAVSLAEAPAGLLGGGSGAGNAAGPANVLEAVQGLRDLLQKK